MITVYVMESCADCAHVKEQLKGNPHFNIVDIGQHVRSLKSFLHLRDTRTEFTTIKARGAIGIPCFVQEDGKITFELDDIHMEETSGSTACSINGTASSIDGAACNIDGAASSIDGATSSIDGTACSIDGTACSIDGTACSIDGTACSIDGTGC